MAIRYEREEEAIANALRAARRGSVEAQRPTGTERARTMDSVGEAVSAADEALAAAGQAAADALIAKSTADGKNSIFAQAIKPVAHPEVGFVAGDLWYQTDIDGKFVNVFVWNAGANDFVEHRIVASSVLVPGSIGPVLIENGAITGQKIAADAIDGKTITGALIKTRANGQRWEIDSNGITGFDSSGVEQIKLFPVGVGLIVGGASDGTPGSHRTEIHSNAAIQFSRTKAIGTDLLGYVGRTGLMLNRDPSAIGHASRSTSQVAHGAASLHAYMDDALGHSHSARLDATDPNGPEVFLQRVHPTNPSFARLRANAGRSRLEVDGILAARAGGDLNISSPVNMSGNAFQLKSDLDAWWPVDGTHAWVTSEGLEYVRSGSAWKLVPVSLPASQRVGFDGQTLVTAAPGSWQDVPNVPPVTFKNSFSRTMEVRLDFGAVTVASAGYVMLGVLTSGATTIGPRQPTRSTDVESYGFHAPFQVGTNEQMSAAKVVRIPPGTVTFQMQSRREVAGVHAANYPSLVVTPIGLI